MATNKKVTPKGGARAAKGLPARHRGQPEDSTTVRILTSCFTVLCVTFAALAFRRYY